MATVCGSSLALMDAGVPLARPVAGIAMGLIKEGERFAVLSDILGDEDHLGDMDFKVAGTEQGVTSLQMDIKITGITEEIMQIALTQARDGRLHILGEMAKGITGAREEMRETVPRISVIHIPQDKIGEVIGPGGKVIREICETTKTKIDIEDDGTIKVASSDATASQQAIDWIRGLTSEPEIGVIYNGKVVRVVDFGAFVNFLGSQDGLCHISELKNERVGKVTDVVNEGDTVKVKVLGIDDRGKVKLSMRGIDQETGEETPVEPRPPRPPRPFGEGEGRASGRAAIAVRAGITARADRGRRRAGGARLRARRLRRANPPRHLVLVGLGAYICEGLTVRRRAPGLRACARRRSLKHGVRQGRPAAGRGYVIALEAPGSVRSRGLATGRRRQGHLGLQWAEQRRLGRDRRHRHLLRRQRRLHRRARPAGAAGLSRPDPARAPRGADRLLDPGGDQPGAHRPRRARRRGPPAHERAVGDGGLRARAARRARRRQGSGPRHHLRRRHALPPGRDRGQLQRLLLPDRVLGARLPRAVEARLSPSVGLAGRRGLRGPVARRRP